ncbi:hypothetical protein NEUTE2DRAFT_159242 [Neurospora tetrasperma FGSC 2509]|nr:hypothetical protein NEUTE2DRAFT_159242 [Neurospora tetrasperma FGSC 2509]
MSAMDIVSTVTILINLGMEIKASAADYQSLLLKVFKDPVNEDIIQANASEFIIILNILESIGQSCKECAKALDIELAGASIATKTESGGKKFFKRIWAFNKIPDLLADIQRKAEQHQRAYSAVSIVFLQHIKVQQGRTSGKEIVESSTVVRKPTNHENLLDLDVSTNFANIDRIVGSLMKECENLRRRLQEATLFPDPSVVQDYQAQNPEAASFWKDRFQKEQLNASNLRYETLYVFWVRFVYEVDTLFVLNKIPTGVFYPGDIDLVRQQGSYYWIDQGGTRRLSTIRPFWLPALRSALDPLHKGYVKPHDYFNLLQDSSLSDTLRRLALENAGYGTLVECERASGDLPLPAAIESPSDHVGWISAQIVAVPTPEELGIVTERQVLDSSSDALFAYFNNTTQDVHIYVRYLQTGQIERKSLSKQVRPVGGISLGATLSIRYELESGDHGWSGDLQITEFKACVGSNAIVFSTRPVKDSFSKMLRDDDNPSSSIIPGFECTLLGPSTAFSHPPKVGEKVQVEYDGLWYDSRVTVVDGDEIEFVDWDSALEQGPIDATETQDDPGSDDEYGSDGFFFPEEQLTELGKGMRRLWRPWRRNIQRYDVRPYRCFHIGDTVEAPVMYPDFRYHYHVTDNSELPALSVHSWWLGRIPKGEQIDLVPGSGIKVENPFDFNRVTVGMDRVRPFSPGPRPVLGIQSAKPAGWSSFQGVRLCNLEDLLERSLWDNL